MGDLIPLPAQIEFSCEANGRKMGAYDDDDDNDDDDDDDDADDDGDGDGHDDDDDELQNALIS